MLKFIVIDSGSSASKLMFYDLKNQKNIIEVSNVFNIKNPILKVLNKIHMSGKINRKINLPFKQIWDKFYITEIAKNSKDHYFIIMTNISVKKFRLEYLKELQNRENIDLVLVAVDSFIDKQLSPLNEMKLIRFKYIFSFDENDCKKYNLIYTNSLYSKIENLSYSNYKSDIFFIGRAKDRYNMLKEFAIYANLRGYKCNFFILGVKRKMQEKIPGITYINRVIKYDKVLPMIQSSKCLLDITQKGQNGLTMRVYESIFYNKKLITNNSNVKTNNYYNENYMKIFTTEEELKNIDLSFINDENSNYFYKGDFSPIKLINYIITNNDNK